MLETSFLVEYLSTYPEKIDEWRRADKKTGKQFRPVNVREALDRRDNYKSESSERTERTRIYGLISKLA